MLELGNAYPDFGQNIERLNTQRDNIARAMARGPLGDGVGVDPEDHGRVGQPVEARFLVIFCYSELVSDFVGSVPFFIIRCILDPFLIVRGLLSLLSF